MAEQRKIELKCYHLSCKNDPTIIYLDVTPGVGRPGETKRIEQYCKRDHLNVIMIPANLGVHQHVFGGDIQSYNGNVPVVSGRDPFAGSTNTGTNSNG